MDSYILGVPDFSRFKVQLFARVQADGRGVEVVSGTPFLYEVGEEVGGERDDWGVARIDSAMEELESKMIEGGRLHRHT